MHTTESWKAHTPIPHQALDGFCARVSLFGPGVMTHATWPPSSPRPEGEQGSIAHYRSPKDLGAFIDCTHPTAPRRECTTRPHPRQCRSARVGPSHPTSVSPTTGTPRATRR